MSSKVEILQLYSSWHVVSHFLGDEDEILTCFVYLCLQVTIARHTKTTVAALIVDYLGTEMHKTGKNFNSSQCTKSEGKSAGLSSYYEKCCKNVSSTRRLFEVGR